MFCLQNLIFRYQVGQTVLFQSGIMLNESIISHNSNIVEFMVNYIPSAMPFKPCSSFLRLNPTIIEYHNSTLTWLPEWWPWYHSLANKFKAIAIYSKKKPLSDCNMLFFTFSQFHELLTPCGCWPNSECGCASHPNKTAASYEPIEVYNSNKKHISWKRNSKLLAWALLFSHLNDTAQNLGKFLCIVDSPSKARNAVIFTY